MRYFIFLFSVILIFTVSCKSSESTNSNPIDSSSYKKYDFTIAFGSCNKQNSKNALWPAITDSNPDVWIWGGDNIYSDTDDMIKLKADYDIQLANKEYKTLVNSTMILGTWDDHDYGLNDGGEEFVMKKESQSLFLDFLGVEKNSERRQREGVYHSEIFKHKKGTIKVIVLDTRYFRSALTEDTETKKRYKPGAYGEGTVLGETQWQWLKNELQNSKTDFNIIVSSIQILSKEHGFETWGNFPHEVDRLKSEIKKSKAKGVILLSGDRHISEFSKTTIETVDYPIYDFTSSGLTHAYRNFTSEPNQYRVGKVVAKESFGLLQFNFETKTVSMQMRGEHNILLQEQTETY